MLESKTKIQRKNLTLLAVNKTRDSFSSRLELLNSSDHPQVIFFHAVSTLILASKSNKIPRKICANQSQKNYITAGCTGVFALGVGVSSEGTGS